MACAHSRACLQAVRERLSHPTSYPPSPLHGRRRLTHPWRVAGLPTLPPRPDSDQAAPTGAPDTPRQYAAACEGGLNGFR